MGDLDFRGGGGSIAANEALGLGTGRGGSHEDPQAVWLEFLLLKAARIS